MNKIRIGILGYGNLGKGVEYAVSKNADTELAAVFSRRDPQKVKTVLGAPVFSIDEAKNFKDKIDVLIMCGGSATDLPVQSVEFVKYFNIVVYSILEVDVDTNYISVTKSSLEYDYYYEPDEIDVRFVGRFGGGSVVDTLNLPTIEKTINGETRTFFYTDKKLLKNQDYEVLVFRKADSVLVTAKTKTINKIVYKKPVGKYIKLQNVNTNRVEWVSTGCDEAPKINAGYFEVYAYFHYRELMPGSDRDGLHP